MKEVIIEFFATFLLLLAILEGAVQFYEASPHMSLFMASLVAGLAVTILIRLFGKISGAHMNPAVSTAMWLDRQLSFGMFVGFAGAQLAGSAVAALVIHAVHSNGYHMGNTTPSVSGFEAWWIELMLTFLLLSVIYVFTDTRYPKLNRLAPESIGLTVFLEIYFAGNITGASMNPARSFGPAIVSQTIGFLWIYFTATFVGAILAQQLNRLRKLRNSD